MSLLNRFKNGKIKGLENETQPVDFFEKDGRGAITGDRESSSDIFE